MKKEEIANWFLNGADPGTGRLLLEKHASNPRQARMARCMSPETVAYELKLILGIPKAEIFVKKKTDVELVREYAGVPNAAPVAKNDSVPPKTERFATPSEKKSHEGLMLTAKPVAIDTVILRAKETIAALSVKVARTHRKLFDTGESNTPKLKELRKGMVEEIREMTALKDQIHDLKEDYFETGNVSRDLLPLIREAEERLNPEPAKGKTKEDLTKIDGAALFKRKENLRKNIARYVNRLKYQTNTRQAKEDPMPEGPERVKIERKLEELRNELTAVQAELQKREKSK